VRKPLLIWVFMHSGETLVYKGVLCMVSKPLFEGILCMVRKPMLPPRTDPPKPHEKSGRRG
jgi:hypothetical protein